MHGIPKAKSADAVLESGPSDPADAVCAVACAETCAVTAETCAVIAVTCAVAAVEVGVAAGEAARGSPCGGTVHCNCTLNYSYTTLVR